MYHQQIWDSNINSGNVNSLSLLTLLNLDLQLLVLNCYNIHWSEGPGWFSFHWTLHTNISVNLSVPVLILTPVNDKMYLCTNVCKIELQLVWPSILLIFTLYRGSPLRGHPREKTILRGQIRFQMSSFLSNNPLWKDTPLGQRTEDLVTKCICVPLLRGQFWWNHLCFIHYLSLSQNSSSYILKLLARIFYLSKESILV
jgi:hypothetical protein